MINSGGQHTQGVHDGTVFVPAEKMVDNVGTSWLKNFGTLVRRAFILVVALLTAKYFVIGLACLKEIW